MNLEYYRILLLLVRKNCLCICFCGAHSHGVIVTSTMNIVIVLDSYVPCDLDLVCSHLPLLQTGAEYILSCVCRSIGEVEARYWCT